MSRLPIFIDPDRTMNEFRFAQGHGCIIKHPDDLERYAKIIADTKPDVIVECGTWAGASAAWFARQGPNVITIDIRPQMGYRLQMESVWPSLYAKITWLTGSTVDPRIVDRVAELVAGKRVMVVLDSAHMKSHVEQEIEYYRGLVSPGCYLVVEDGIFRYANHVQWHKWDFGDPSQGTPLDAIESTLVGDPDWERDEEIEGLTPISHHPGGFWIRK